MAGKKDVSKLDKSNSDKHTVDTNSHNNGNSLISIMDNLDKHFSTDKGNADRPFFLRANDKRLDEGMKFLQNWKHSDHSKKVRNEDRNYKGKQHQDSNYQGKQRIDKNYQGNRRVDKKNYQGNQRVDKKNYQGNQRMDNKNYHVKQRMDKRNYQEKQRTDKNYQGEQNKVGKLRDKSKSKWFTIINYKKLRSNHETGWERIRKKKQNKKRGNNSREK